MSKIKAIYLYKNDENIIYYPFSSDFETLDQENGIKNILGFSTSLNETVPLFDHSPYFYLKQQ